MTFLLGYNLTILIQWEGWGIDFWQGDNKNFVEGICFRFEREEGMTKFLAGGPWLVGGGGGQDSPHPPVDKTLDIDIQIDRLIFIYIYITSCAPVAILLLQHLGIFCVTDIDGIYIYIYFRLRVQRSNKFITSCLIRPNDGRSIFPNRLIKCTFS